MQSPYSTNLNPNIPYYKPEIVSIKINATEQAASIYVYNGIVLI